LYDSLNSEVYLKEMRKDLVRIDNAQLGGKGRIEVYTLNMQKQDGFTDCGLFAIACTYELCNGRDPAKIQFTQSQMRSHFQQCLDVKIMSSFPQVPRETEIVYKKHQINRA